MGMKPRNNPGARRGGILGSLDRPTASGDILGTLVMLGADGAVTGVRFSSIQGEVKNGNETEK